jgi:hypothetical protein
MFEGIEKLGNSSVILDSTDVENELLEEELFEAVGTEELLDVVGVDEPEEEEGELLEVLVWVMELLVDGEMDVLELKLGAPAQLTTSIDRRMVVSNCLFMKIPQKHDYLYII